MALIKPLLRGQKLLLFIVDSGNSLNDELGKGFAPKLEYKQHMTKAKSQLEPSFSTQLYFL